jgi:hypothetical protein
MSIGATYGLMGYCGVPLTPVTNVLPFILIGVVCVWRERVCAYVLASCAWWFQEL